MRAARCSLVMAALVLHGHASGAVTLEKITCSPGTTVSLDMQLIDDADIAHDDLAGNVTMDGLGGLPLPADLDAYHRDTDGLHFFSLDTTIQLPFGPVAERTDVVYFNGSDYGLAFDASDHGVPGGANLDALSFLGESDLLISFDVSVMLNGVHGEDEDLFLLDEVGFTLFWDGSTAGVPADLDLDAAHLVACTGQLLLSFDGSGTVGGVPFEDEDVLLHDPEAGTWEVAYDGSALHPEWSPADLDAVHAEIEESPPGVVAGVQVFSADTTLLSWTSQDPSAGTATVYDIVSGLVDELREVAGFQGAACLANDHPDTPYGDTRPDPEPGRALYYLLRAQNLCSVASYGDGTQVPDPRDDLDVMGPCP